MTVIAFAIWPILLLALSISSFDFLNKEVNSISFIMSAFLLFTSLPPMVISCNKVLYIVFSIISFFCNHLHIFCCFLISHKQFNPEMDRIENIEEVFRKIRFGPALPIVQKDKW